MCRIFMCCLKPLITCVDTSRICVDTSSLLPSIETHCFQVSTLIEPGVDTLLSVFMKFSYWPQVSILLILGVDTYFFRFESLLTIFRCRHFIFSDSSIWLLTLDVDISVAGVNTSCSRISYLATDFRCRHFYSKCWHYSLQNYLFGYWLQVSTLL